MSSFRGDDQEKKWKERFDVSLSPGQGNLSCSNQDAMLGVKRPCRKMWVLCFSQRTTPCGHKFSPSFTQYSSVKKGEILAEKKISRCPETLPGVNEFSDL